MNKLNLKIPNLNVNDYVSGDLKISNLNVNDYVSGDLKNVLNIANTIDPVTNLSNDFRSFLSEIFSFQDKRKNDTVKRSKKIGKKALKDRLIDSIIDNK